MDLGINHTNTFIQDPKLSNREYGLTEEIRKDKLREYQSSIPHAPHNDQNLQKDILKVNKVIDHDGKLKIINDGVLIKEQRTVLSVNSNQRNYVKESTLTDPSEYFNYIEKSVYNEFAELYQLASDIGASLNIQSYQQYASENNISIIPITASEAKCRSLVRNLISNRSTSQVRSLSASASASANAVANRSVTQEVADINSNLINLLTSIAVNVSGRSDYETVANTLNAFAMSGAAYNPDNFWRPFYFTGLTGDNDDKIKQVIYNEQYPHKYTITLPSIIKHVKSIRLLSTEIPNTINNINERNNIITIQLRKKAVPNINNGLPVPVELLGDKSAFNFILIKLDVGNYTIDSLIQHFNDKINSSTRFLTKKLHGELFTVTWNKSTGQLSISCNRPEIEFHLKFYSELTGITDVVNPGVEGQVLGKTHGVITNYSHDLWHILGFPWPYEITSDGTDKYTSLLTNVVNFGIHEVFEKSHLNNDIFDRKNPENAEALDQIYSDTINLNGGQFDILNTYRAYRYPQLQSYYIYLVLKGFKSMRHINQFNGVTSFRDGDFFAKILLNVGTGEVAYNTFVSNPLIFLNALDKIEKLEIEWVDERGNTVDFNKVDHSFTLEIIHYVTQLEVNEYDSGLGQIDTKSYPDYLN